MSQYLFFLLILACPLMMIFMMRGGHGHGAHGGPGSRTESANSSHDGCEHDARSIDELKRQRADIDRTIAEREAAEYGDRTLEPTR